jgi:signal transduction histidine kinase
LLIYRVIQELLNNIIKHAGANHITIEITQFETDLLVTVSDNGVGFDVENRLKDPAKGLGLRNMAHRLNLINGKMSISSQPGKGTTTILTIHTQPEAK